MFFTSNIQGFVSSTFIASTSRPRPLRGSSRARCPPGSHIENLEFITLVQGILPHITIFVSNIIKCRTSRPRPSRGTWRARYVQGFLIIQSLHKDLCSPPETGSSRDGPPRLRVQILEAFGFIVQGFGWFVADRTIERWAQRSVCLPESEFRVETLNPRVVGPEPEPDALVPETRNPIPLQTHLENRNPGTGTRNPNPKLHP